MATPKNRLVINDIVEKGRYINVTATRMAAEQMREVNGIEHIADGAHAGTYWVYISSLYDFNEVVNEIKAIDESMPEIISAQVIEQDA